jgi:hypothetical protein
MPEKCSSIDGAVGILFERFCRAAMSSKEQKPSKKAVREKKDRAIEDATFGLKNKNKSKKVQQFINRVEKSVKNQNGGVDAVRTLLPSLVLSGR